MSTNGSNALHPQWGNLIENLNATADDRGDPFFQKAVLRLESFWVERVVSQKDEASATLLSALAQGLTVYSAADRSRRHSSTYCRRYSVSPKARSVSSQKSAIAR